MTDLQLIERPQDGASTGLTASMPGNRHISVSRRPEPDAPLTAPQSTQPAVPVREDSWLADIEKQIRSFAELPHDWDSYGGGAVPRSIVEAAVDIAGVMSAVGFSRPEVCPESSGGVLLEWHDAGKTLTVDIDFAVGLSVERGFSFAYESPGEQETEGDLADFVTFLGAGVQPF